jgi:hypothetical protein
MSDVVMRTPMGMQYVAAEDLDRMENELREAERELARLKYEIAETSSPSSRSGGGATSSAVAVEECPQYGVVEFDGQFAADAPISLVSRKVQHVRDDHERTVAMHAAHRSVIVKRLAEIDAQQQRSSVAELKLEADSAAAATLAVLRRLDDEQAALSATSVGATPRCGTPRHIAT